MGIAWIWLYDVCGLIFVDLLKYILGLLKLGWMSAGAAGGTLEYAELPEEADERGPVLRSSLLQTSRASARSVAAPSRVSGSSASGGSFRSPSTLPYPYNLRAAAV